jgi:hypothetical protein
MRALESDSYKRHVEIVLDVIYCSMNEFLNHHCVR